MVMLLPRDAGAPAAAPIARATSAFPIGGFIHCAMGQSVTSHHHCRDISAFLALMFGSYFSHA